MASVGAMTFAGALGGLGNSMVENAKRSHERNLMAIRRQWQKEDQATAHSQSMERMGYQDSLQRDRMGMQNQFSIDAENRNEARIDARTSQAANVYESLFGTESGGNFGAQNDEGYTGRSQFGQDRLDDFSRVHGIGKLDIEKFRTDEKMQEDVERWHFADINNFIDQHDLMKYEGQRINGVTMTRSGLVAMAHLGGSGGMKKFLETGGGYNPEDSNGTSLSDYAQTHGGLSTDMREVFKIMADPRQTPEARKMASGFAQNTFGMGEAMKFGNREWVKQEDGTSMLMLQAGDSPQFIPAIGADGRPIIRQEGESDKWRELPSTDITDIQQRMAKEFDLDPQVADQNASRFRTFAEDLLNSYETEDGKALTVGEALRITKESAQLGVETEKGLLRDREVQTDQYNFDGFDPRKAGIRRKSQTGAPVAAPQATQSLGGAASTASPAPSAQTVAPSMGAPAAPQAPQQSRAAIPSYPTVAAVDAAIRNGDLKLGATFKTPQGKTKIVTAQDLQRARKNG